MKRVNLIQRVIKFTESGLKSHEDYETIPIDPLMEARVIRLTEKDNICTIDLDMVEFFINNTDHMQDNWPPTGLKWTETDFYPKDHKIRIVYHKNLPPFVLR